jgi:hypothetical protein
MSQLGERGTEPIAVRRSGADHDSLAEQDRQADVEGPERASSEFHRHGLTHRTILRYETCAYDPPGIAATCALVPT